MYEERSMKGWKEVLNFIFVEKHKKEQVKKLRFYYPSDVSLLGEEEVGCSDCQVKRMSYEDSECRVCCD